MKLIINGEEKEVGATTVAELVEAMSLTSDHVAIAVNNAVVARVKWTETQLSDGDRIMIINAAYGG